MKNASPTNLPAQTPAKFEFAINIIAAKVMRDWLTQVGVKTMSVEQGDLWENGYRESFNGKLRDKPLNGEIFYS